MDNDYHLLEVPLTSYILVTGHFAEDMAHILQYYLCSVRQHKTPSLAVFKKRPMVYLFKQVYRVSIATITIVNMSNSPLNDNCF